MIDPSSQPMAKDSRSFLVVLKSAADHLGEPLAVFGAVFLAAVLIVMVLFSPGRFPVRVGEKVVLFSSLLQEESSLHADEVRLLAQKQKIEDSQPTPVLKQLLALRASLPSLGPTLLAINTVWQTFILDGANPIRFDAVSWDGATGAIELAGTVEDRGGGSLQLLSTFVDNLRSRSEFASVTEPEYQQLERPDGTKYSPLHLILHPRVR